MPKPHRPNSDRALEVRKDKRLGTQERRPNGSHTKNYVAGGLIAPRERLPPLGIDVLEGENKTLHAWRVLSVGVGTCDVELKHNDTGSAIAEGSDLGIELKDGDTLDFYVFPSSDAEDLTITFTMLAT